VERLFNLRGAALLGLVFWTSCARQRTIDRDELRSDLTAGISLGSEANLYLQSAVEHRTSRSFSQGHLRYLAEEATRTKKELQQSVASPKDAATLKQACLEYEALSQELTLVGEKPSESNALLKSMRRLTEIGNALKKAKDSL
jgi:hypothetical protein